MFCIHCGNTLEENAKFCAHCGKAVGTAPQPPQPPRKRSPQEWEYTFYRSTWKPGKGGRFNLVFGKTEYDARLMHWGGDESWLMPRLQKFIDNGWEPVGKIGPGNYHFRKNQDRHGIHWLEVHTFLVEFRRPTRPLTTQETEILGVWRETHDPNKGFLRKFSNVVFDQKVNIDRARIEFYKDKRFESFRRDGKLSRSGIFFTNKDGGIEVMYKYSPDFDGVVAVVEGKLVMQRNNKGYAKDGEYERVP
ncbi:MAG: zinc ribbon domain-containing protein [Ardenticatenaceae bacterium]|nr:zinc ribbon domain-containing protein [Anaerolineales bacterium]MCB8922992.1 zinc ribbon domain-containing protein [Ardenticatenaceae bacterium]MCB8990275.1 zinc ribbon domain-containing protein [Ardenticatenaceae bacterium]